LAFFRDCMRVLNTEFLSVLMFWKFPGWEFILVRRSISIYTITWASCSFFLSSTIFDKSPSDYLGGWTIVGVALLTTLRNGYYTADAGFSVFSWLAFCRATLDKFNYCCVLLSFSCKFLIWFTLWLSVCFILAITCSLYCSS